MTACSVRLNPDTGAWKVHYRQDGRSRSRSFDSEREADRWAAHVRAAGIDDALAALADKSTPERIVTLNEALAHHLAQRVLKPGTRIEYELMAARTWGRTLGPLPVHVINKTRVVGWVRHAHEVEGRSPKTITNAHGLLSGVMATAVEEGWVTANPCRSTRMPTAERREKVWLTPQQVATFMAELPAYWRPLVLLLAATGMRFGEATALQWRDLALDTDQPTVRVSRGWHKVGGTYVLSSPKTNRSVRTVRLPPVAADVLRQLRRDRADDARDALVFRGEKGGTRVHPAWFREHIWHPARVRAGIVERATPHSLRDSHVAWQIARGTDLAVIQRRLGHESITTTINVYGHLEADVVEQSVDAAQDALTALPGPT